MVLFIVRGLLRDRSRGDKTASRRRLQAKAASASKYTLGRCGCSAIAS
ncbi:hypothetical protein [Chlorogloeopsis sp. ULAP02]